MKKKLISVAYYSEGVKKDKAHRIDSRRIMAAVKRWMKAHPSATIKRVRPIYSKGMVEADILYIGPSSLCPRAIHTQRITSRWNAVKKEA